MRRFLLAGASWLAISAATAEAAPIAFNYTGSSVDWIVPTTGQWEIIAAGAQGGRRFGAAGGFGARVTGTFALSAGTQLRILVGGVGGFSPDGIGSGGGGGSFVVALADTPLAVAGGGGGASYSSGGPGLSAQGAAGGAGGIGLNSGGGGGFRTAGGSIYGGGGGGQSFLAGGAGGAALQGYYAGGPGGFGGGGGGGSSGGGGGGGYTGGTGGSYSDSGLGGTSFLALSALNQVRVDGFQSGNGFVSLEFLRAVEVPAPGALALFGTGLIGLMALGRRRG